MQIQGFDLSQVSWKAFRWEEMFSRRWYLRRERLIVYTLTLMMGTAAQIAGTYCMYKYGVLKGQLEGASTSAVHARISDIRSASIVSVSLPAAALLLLNAEYVALQFWPARTYSARYLAWKKAVFVGAACGMVATSVVCTVIVAMRSATITGVNEAAAQKLIALFPHPPLRYRAWGHNIVWLALLWTAAALSMASTTLLIMALPQERANPGLGASASSSDEKIGAPDASENCDVLTNANVGGKPSSSVSKR